MASYKYMALKKNGEKLQGVYEAKSKEEVLLMIRDNQYYPVKVEEYIEGKDIKGLSFLSKVKIKDIAVFCRQFYSMLNSGVPILSCLDILRLQTESKKLRKVIGEVFEEVQKGLTLSEALRKYKAVFPELLINMVEAGEVSGNLDIIMDRMANHYEKENKINNKVKGAMTYPIILGIIATFVVIFLITVVMPTFVGMFQGSGVELPLPTRILLSISEAIKGYWYIFVLVIGAIVYGFSKYLKSDNGKLVIDSIKLKIPIVKGTTQKIITSRFTRTLSTLLSSGIPLLEALEIVSKIVGNKKVAQGIMKSKEEVRKGVNLADPIKKIGVFPPMVVSMIKIGEESGSLDEILDKTANFYDDEVEVSLQKLTTMLEPLMIVFMALIIGAIVIAMVLPMFDMINTIQM